MKGGEKWGDQNLTIKKKGQKKKEGKSNNLLMIIWGKTVGGGDHNRPMKAPGGQPGTKKGGLARHENGDKRSGRGESKEGEEKKRKKNGNIEMKRVGQ